MTPWYKLKICPTLLTVFKPEKHHHQQVQESSSKDFFLYTKLTPNTCWTRGEYSEFKLQFTFNCILNGRLFHKQALISSHFPFLFLQTYHQASPVGVWCGVATLELFDGRVSPAPHRIIREWSQWGGKMVIVTRVSTRVPSLFFNSDYHIIIELLP